MAECSGNSSYEPNGLVQAIHDTPRFGVDQATNQSFFSISYFQAFLYWSLTPFVLGACIFIILFIYSCCICCCCCKKQRKKSRSANGGCVIFISILIALCLGTIGASIFTEVELNRDISEAIELGENIQDTAELVIAKASGYPADDVSDAIGELCTALDCTGSDDPDCEALYTLEEANKDIQQAVNEINSVFTSINSTIAEEVLFIVSSETVNEYETIRHWCIIGFLCLVAIVLLMLCISVLSCSRSAIIYFLVLVFIVALICDLLVGVFLGVSIISADVCIDPVAALENFTGIIDPLTTITNDTFYISCMCNPLAQETDLLSSALGEAENALMDLQLSINTYLSGENQTQALSELATISSAIMVAENASNTITDILQCQPSNGTTVYLDQALFNLCTDGYVYMAVTLFLLAGLGIMLVILICSSISFAGLLCATRQGDRYDDRDLIPFDNGHASWGNQYSTSYNTPYSATNACSFQPTSSYKPGLTSAAPPNYIELQPQHSGYMSEEYDRYEA